MTKISTIQKTGMMSGEIRAPPNSEEPVQGQFSDAESCTSYDSPNVSGFRPFFAQDSLPTVVVKPRVKKEETRSPETESRDSSGSELWDTSGPTYNPTLPGQFEDAESEEAPTDWLVDTSVGEEAKSSSVNRSSTRQRFAPWVSWCPKLTVGRATVVTALSTAALTSIVFFIILSSQTNKDCPVTEKASDLPEKTKVNAAQQEKVARG